MISAKIMIAKLYEHRNDQKNRIIKEFSFHAKIISKDEWTTIHGWNKIIDDFFGWNVFHLKISEFSWTYFHSIKRL